MVTTNLPFEQRTEVLGSERLTEAVLGRLSHSLRILEANGESYRLGDAKKTPQAPLFQKRQGLLSKEGLAHSAGRILSNPSATLLARPRRTFRSPFTVQPDNQHLHTLFLSLAC